MHFSNFMQAIIEEQGITAFVKSSNLLFCYFKRIVPKCQDWSFNFQYIMHIATSSTSRKNIPHFMSPQLTNVFGNNCITMIFHMSGLSVIEVTINWTEKDWAPDWTEAKTNNFQKKGWSPTPRSRFSAWLQHGLWQWDMIKVLLFFYEKT